MKVLYLLSVFLVALVVASGAKVPDRQPPYNCGRMGACG